jgi:TonB-linked SusC/RagA family outer membrane protein
MTELRVSRCHPWADLLYGWPDPWAAWTSRGGGNSSRRRVGAADSPERPLWRSARVLTAFTEVVVPRHTCLRTGIGLLCVAGALAGSSRTASAQGRTVTGRVTDGETKEPLPAVTIIIRGTLRGTNTKENGTYSINLPTAATTLTFRRIGYKATDHVVPADQTTADVTLARDVLRLEESIVTGQATVVSRQSAANDVSTVDAQEINRVPAQTPELALQGKIAGADIQENSGAPGGGMQVRLRGTSTIIGNSDPLYVVDGVIISNANIAAGTNAVTAAESITQGISGGGIASREDNPSNRLADLDPNDIENIEVLKGASASAIYGSKASNGVVLITTKRGQTGAPEFRFGQKFGASKDSRQLGSRLFDSASAVATWGPNAAPFFAGGTGQAFNHEAQLAGRSPLSYQSTASLSGGSENTRYYSSGIVEHDGGIIQNTYFDKQALNVNLNQVLGQRFELGFGSAFSHSGDGRGLTNNDNTTTSFYTALPSTPSFVNLQERPDGSWPVNPFAPSNPLQTAALLTNVESINRFIGSGRGTIHLLTSDRNTLNFLMNGGIDYFNQLNSLYSPPSLQFEQIYHTDGTSVLSNSESLNSNINANLVDIFTPSSGAFTATSQVGIEQETRYINTGRTLARVLAPGLSNVDRGTQVSVAQLRQNVVDKGIFLQEEFQTLGQRLLVTLGGRADQSSDNASPTHLNYYPKASASYRLTKGIAFIDDAKLRAAFGESGNEPLYGQKFGELNAANYTGLPTSQILGSIAAPDLRPERTQEFETGFDLTMFHGKATLGVTGYQKNISDLLLQRGLPPSTGYILEFLNGGTMRTRGLEVETQVAAVQRRDLQWTINANFSKDASIVTALPVSPFTPAGFPPEFGGFFIQQGKSPTQIVGNVTTASGTTPTGTIGDANPDYRVGLGSNLTYHRAHLYFLFNWQHHGDDINLTQLLYDFTGNSADWAKVVNTPGGPKPLGGYRVTSWLSNTATIVQDASFIKLRELSLSYDLPQSLLANLGNRVRSASLTAEGRNLITWTKYQGLDPEVSNFGNQAVARNVDVAPFPPSRTFWFGINLGF